MGVKMKKNQNENLNLQLKRGFTTLITGLLFSISSPQLMYAENAIVPLLSEEAKILSDREEQLFSARKKEDWEKIHGLQHPDFRKKVSVDEIRYFEGWVASDYREKAKQNAHISGAFVPTLDFIKKIQNFGISRIIYTDIYKDGTKLGPNIKNTIELSSKTKIPLVISGGVSSLEDIKKIKSLSNSNIEGVIIGKAIYDGDIKINDLAKLI